MEEIGTPMDLKILDPTAREVLMAVKSWVKLYGRGPKILIKKSV